MIFQTPHPLLVHFPIALLTVSLVTRLFSTHTRWAALEKTADYLLYWGTAGALAAVGSGLWAERAALHAHTFEIGEIMEDHQNAGWTVLTGSLLLSLWRWKRPLWKLALQQVVHVLLVVVISWGGWLGGRLVYEHGVGTQIYGRAHQIQVETKTPEEHQEEGHE